MATLANEIINLVCIFLLSGIGLYFIRDIVTRAKAQEEYERAYIERHQDFINAGRWTEPNNFIPLNFGRTDRDYLINICKQHPSKWSPMYYLNKVHLRSYEPSVQTHYLYFRRVVVLPYIQSLPIQLIRCSDYTALIDAGDGLSAYILDRGPSDEGINITKFYIYAKFNYRSGTPQIAQISELPVFQVVRN